METVSLAPEQEPTRGSDKDETIIDLRTLAADPTDLAQSPHKDHPTLDGLASNINPAVQGKPPKIDNYWHNAADIHSVHPQAVKAAERIAGSNHLAQIKVDSHIAEGGGDAREQLRDTDEWYRSLGTLNSLHNQGGRLEGASDVMLAATMRQYRASSIEDLVRQDRSGRGIAYALTALDMKIDASHDPVRENMTAKRIELLSEARSKAALIGSKLDVRLEHADNMPGKERADLVAQRYRALKIQFGTFLDHIQVLAQHSLTQSQRAESTATEAVGPKFTPDIQGMIHKAYPAAESFADQYDALIHDDLYRLSQEALKLMRAGHAPNGDVFEIVSFLMVARQYCTSDNADIGEYTARFATWRQDSPMDNKRDDGKHSFDIELVNNLPEPDKPTWRIPIQVKAKGAGGASESAEQYDNGIVVFNLFEQIAAEQGTYNAQGSENAQIARRLQDLLVAIAESEAETLNYYRGKASQPREVDDRRRSLIAAERELRDVVSTRLQGERQPH